MRRLGESGLADGKPREKGEMSGKGWSGHTGTGLPILYTSLRGGG